MKTDRPRIGKVYTPSYWASWAVRRFQIHRRWMQGGRILDPAAGEGALLEAVLTEAREEGFTPGSGDLMRLVGIERDVESLNRFRLRMKEKHGILWPEESLIHGDFLQDHLEVQTDMVFANPPWVTFADLPDGEKQALKRTFRLSGLVPAPQELLLGASRVDIAALFVQKVHSQLLGPGAPSYWFLPLSLFRSEGAHALFRRFRTVQGKTFAPKLVVEIDRPPSFPGAGTRFGFVVFQSGIGQRWPIGWERLSKRKSLLAARPVDEEGSPFIVVEQNRQRDTIPRIRVREERRPRQGINTGGAVGAFHLREMCHLGGNQVRGVSKGGWEGVLPLEYVHPLMNSKNFEAQGPLEARNWIILPYRRDGKPLASEHELRKQGLGDWFAYHRQELEQRKGSMLGRWMERGYPWALLGTGLYMWAPWKVAWESYGRREFRPRLFGPETDGRIWQGNQALHAYIPFEKEEDARRCFEAMDLDAIQLYLENLGGQGTRNWAQPGRIRRLISIEND